MCTQLSESEQEQLLEKLQVFKIHGKDKLGCKILLVIGKFFPGNLNLFIRFYFLYLFFKLIGKFIWFEFKVSMFFFSFISFSESWLFQLGYWTSIYWKSIWRRKFFPSLWKNGFQFCTFTPGFKGARIFREYHP